MPLERKSESVREIDEYLTLMDDFIAKAMTAPDFEKAYLAAIKRDRRLFDNDVFVFLQAMWLFMIDGVVGV